MEKIKKSYFGLVPINNVVLPTITPITTLLCDEFIQSTHKLRIITSDINYLFNQMRLDNIGLDNINKWLSSLTPTQSQSITKNMSDDDILAFVKSRHIQSASELLSWSEFLQRQINSSRVSDNVDNSSKNETINFVDNNVNSDV